MLELLMVFLLLFNIIFTTREYRYLKELPEGLLLYKNLRGLPVRWKMILLVELIGLIFVVAVIVIAIVISVSDGVNYFSYFDVIVVVPYLFIYSSKFLYIIKTNIKLKNK